MCADEAAGSTGPINRTLYGRRKGKKLRTYQAGLVSETLPQLSIDCSNPIEPAALFSEKRDEFRMEIGFGGAEHLVHEADHHRAIGYIGCEPFINGVAKLLSQVEEKELTNIRLHHGDAGEVLLRLPDACLTRVDVLYPDPWPQWRQRKRRFLSEQNIDEIARGLKRGSVFRFATDIDDYAGWVLARVLKSPQWKWQEAQTGVRPWQQAWDHWPSTRYEAKAFREGRKPAYFTFIRN
jgi:tRNA (guanine-N7-)-methyltransferase